MHCQINYYNAMQVFPFYFKTIGNKQFPWQCYCAVTSHVQTITEDDCRYANKLWQ